MAFNAALFANAASRIEGGRPNSYMPTEKGKYLVVVSALKENYGHKGEFFIVEGEFVCGADAKCEGKKFSTMVNLNSSDPANRKRDYDRIKSICGSVRGHDLPAVTDARDKAQIKAQRDAMLELLTEMTVTEAYVKNAGEDPSEGVEVGKAADGCVIGFKYSTKKDSAELSGFPYAFKAPLKEGFVFDEKNPKTAIGPDGAVVEIFDALDTSEWD